MRRHTLGAAGLLWISLATAAAAQGADQAVLLRYHFQPGQEFRYRMTLTGDMGMTLGGSALPPGANAPPKMPMTMNGTYEWVQKVKSVAPDGKATVTLSLGAMDLTSSMMGMKMAVRRGPEGKLEVLQNGQPVTPPNAPTQSIPDPLYEATIDPTGKISAVSAESMRSMTQAFGGQNLSTMFNGSMPGMGMLLLPDQPVKPGDTWDTKTQLQVPLSMPGPAAAAPGGAGPAATFTLNYTVHNKLARVEDGRAVIETQATAAVPPGAKLPLPAGAGAPPGLSMTFDKMEQSMTSTQRLQIEQGVMEGGDFDVKMAMAMSLALPPGMAGPGAAPTPKPGTTPRPGTTRPQPKRGARLRTGGASAAAAARRPVTAAPPAPRAPAAPTSFQMSMDGTFKMKIDRVTPPMPAASP